MVDLRTEPATAVARRPRGYGSGMPTFAVRMVHGPNWDDARGIREQHGWDAHASFMDGLVDTGFVVIGGPVGEDPWWPSQLLHVGVIEPWQIWLDGRAEPS